MSKSEATAEELIAKGYRVVSRKHRTVSRIDRDDWKLYMAREHSPWNIEEGLSWIEYMGELHAADFYRRCHSEDTLTVSPAILRKIPNSCYRL